MLRQMPDGAEPAAAARGPAGTRPIDSELARGGAPAAWGGFAVTDSLDLLDFLVLCAGLAAIVWVGLHSSRRKPTIAWSPAAVIGMLVWLAVFGFALYLIFG